MSTTIQNFYKATITRNWSATTGDFNVSVKPTTSSGWLVVSPNNTTLREIIYFTATSTNGFGDFVTVSNIAHRGIGGTSAQTHSIGEAINMNITAEHWAEMQDDIDSIVAAGLPAGTDGQVMVNTAGTWGAGQTTKFSTTEVFNGAAPTSWTDLNLSSVVGATQRMVVLRISVPSSTAVGVTVKTKGDTKTYTNNASYFSLNNVYIPDSTYTATVLVKTDTSGIIQWIAGGATAGTMVDVLAYW